nr:Chain D, cAMP-dependent protein kinase inhibitor alpha [Homo sapiens]
NLNELALKLAGLDINK